MSIRSLISMAAVAIVAGAPMALQAQNAKADFQADNAFVSQVAAANLLEVRLGQTAQTKATTPQVKEFADKMVNDHSSMQQEWMAAARKNDAPFTARFSTLQEQHVAHLKNLSGREFEAAYMDLMVQDHQNNLNTFSYQGRSARSADVRALVERGIPALREHLSLATQIRNDLRGVAVAANQPDTQAAAGAPSPWPNVKTGQPPKTQPPKTQPTASGDQTATAQQNQTNAANANAARANIQKDAEFIHDVTAHHFLEQRLGELAAKKAKDNQVKEYAKKATKEHAELEKQWIAMARNNGMTINAGMGPNHREKVTKLEKKSGRSFDREYMTMEVSNHEWYLNELARDGRNAKVSDVRRMVDRSWPIEMEHWNSAKRVGARVDADTSSALKTTSVR